MGTNDYGADNLMREVQEVDQYFQSMNLLESINKIFECPKVKKLISEIFWDLKHSVECFMPKRAEDKKENSMEKFYYEFDEKSFMEKIKMNYKLKTGYTLKEVLDLVHDETIRDEIVKSIRLQFDKSEEDELTLQEIANIAELIRTVTVQTLKKCIKNVSIQQTADESVFCGDIGFFNKKVPKYLS